MVHGDVIYRKSHVPHLDFSLINIKLAELD